MKTGKIGKVGKPLLPDIAHNGICANGYRMKLKDTVPRNYEVLPRWGGGGPGEDRHEHHLLPPRPRD